MENIYRPGQHRNYIGRNDNSVDCFSGVILRAVGDIPTATGVSHSAKILSSSGEDSLCLISNLLP